MSSTRLVAILAGVLGFAIAACGGKSASHAIVVSGSSTVEPISSAIAEAFKRVNPNVAPSVDGPGTGDGFKLFCNGETDVNDASRKIKDDEKKACADKGIAFVELKVGIDGLTVATSPKNSVDCLDIAALYALTGPESIGIAKWSDAAKLANELGSKSTLPRAQLAIYGPGEESGTYDSYVEFAIKAIATKRGKTGKQIATRPDYNSSPNDNTIVQGIEGSASSFGWVGYAYYKNQGAKLKDIAIDAGQGCINVSDATIIDGTYPFRRDLYIYVNKVNLAKNAALKGFVSYYLSAEGIANVAKVGYISLPADQLKTSQDAWAAVR